MRKDIQFIIITCKVLKMTQLTCLDKIVLSYGQAFTGKKGNRTDAHIAHLLSVKVDRVEKSIARLKKLNLWPIDLHDEQDADANLIPFFVWQDEPATSTLVHQ
jgi:hypothetical protein